MNKKQKFLAPIYGLKKSLKEEIRLDKNQLIRSINLLKGEHKLFEEYGIRASCDAVLEIDYQYDADNPSEPHPGISLNIVNKFDSALLIYGDNDGGVGIAGIFPATGKDFGVTLFTAKTRYEEGLDREIDDDFAIYYKKFAKAYSMRPLAFDVYRKSRDRFANNDKTIDCCTLLESIFVPIGEGSKKSFILNGLNILGFSKQDIEAIEDLVEYRNAIIHADRDKQLKLLSGSKYTFRWFDDTFKLIRRILYRYIESPWS